MFAQLLQSSVTSFVDLEDSLAPVAPPTRGSTTVRMDPALLGAATLGMIGDGEGLDGAARAAGEPRSRGSVVLNAGRSLGGTAIGPDAARRFLAGLVFLQALGIRRPRRFGGLGSLAMPGTSASPATVTTLRVFRVA
ncbi:hypothetical protein PC116_g26081 [Phytophthora cactorum]|uniref:Uncharacterized protein n=1 Tax=Phytophthora cactorum TaxID=29920 RepID=A0A329R7W3_9STRA|nr:hypothetical protein Pcac1_g1855 [Phytophthora cactorum]KAG4225489.1 hypothetical protein PC116_g26081 [Phytophthora cactorum]RAW20490.1 hypothetical protein PC110_g23068 [Phytophthora cactorum]